jgi:hypothetical protein
MLNETRAQQAERLRIHDDIDRRWGWELLTKDRFGVRHKPHTLSAAVRAAVGPKWGTGAQPIREAKKAEDYNIPGITVAAIQEFWHTQSLKALLYKLMERDLREAFFGRSDLSIELVILRAEQLLLSTTQQVLSNSLLGTVSEKALDRAAYYALSGQIALYKGRTDPDNPKSHFVKAIDLFRETYVIAANEGGNTVTLDHDNLAFAVIASASAANLIYALARAFGINHAKTRDEASKIAGKGRLLAAYHLADAVRDPRISNNHAEMALLAGSREDAISLMRLTVSLVPGNRVKEGIWEKPNWLFSDDPELDGFQEVIECAVKDYIASSSRKKGE